MQKTSNLEAEYREMAKNKAWEAEALEWSEATVNEIYENVVLDLGNDLLLKVQTKDLPKEQW